MGITTLIPIAVLFYAVTAATVPFQCQEQKIEKVCLDIIDKDITNLPGFVRLAFHDCVGAGGCDGCIDISNGDNNGLQPYMDALDNKFVDHKVSNIMSRADFWILCSHVALREGQRKSEKPADTSKLSLTMKYGRTDCNKENADQKTNDTYPSPHGNYTRTTSYFNKEFGLSAAETTALLGAHTLGRARVDASGYSNEWVDNEFAFDNDFYKDILDKGLNWTQVDLDTDTDPTNHLQWSQKSATGDFKNLMFSADMCLAVDVQPDTDGVESRNFTDIGNSLGHTLVKTYAEDNKKFLADFSIAYTKMVEKVADGSGITLETAQPDGKVSPCADPVVLTTTESSSVMSMASGLLVLLTTSMLFV